jgi:hypothetical protein
MENIKNTDIDKDNMDTGVKGDPIWIDDYTQLFRVDRLVDFIPKVDMPYSERINAIVRLAFYIGVILTLLHNNYLYLYVPIVVLVATYGIYHFQSNDIKEHYQSIPNSLEKTNEYTLFNRYGNSTTQKVQCVPSTVDNPFMNPLPSDDRTRGPACKMVDNPDVANVVEANFNNNLYKDVNDVYNRRHSERQYYTVPSTTFGNDERGNFVQWLYGGPPTCKESGNQCIANVEYRLNQASRRMY